MAITLTFIGGFVCWYDLIVGDGEIPEPNYVAPSDPIVLQGCINTTPVHWTDDPEKNWEALQPTLEILKPVCPHVEEWVRERHASGHLKWCINCPQKNTESYMATYNWGTGDLTIYKLCFNYSDSEKACTLAHEWRHSRQNFAVFCRESLSTVFLLKPDETLVEDDADLYENKVRLAYYNQDVVTSLARRQIINEIIRSEHGLDK